MGPGLHGINDMNPKASSSQDSFKVWRLWSLLKTKSILLRRTSDLALCKFISYQTIWPIQHLIVYWDCALLRPHDKKLASLLAATLGDSSIRHYIFLLPYLHTSGWPLCANVPLSNHSFLLLVHLRPGETFKVPLLFTRRRS